MHKRKAPTSKGAQKSNVSPAQDCKVPPGQGKRHPLSAKFVCEKRCHECQAPGRCNVCRPCRLSGLFTDWKPCAVNLQARLLSHETRGVGNQLARSSRPLCPDETLPPWLASVPLFTTTTTEFTSSQIGQNADNEETAEEGGSTLLLRRQGLALRRQDIPPGPVQKIREESKGFWGEIPTYCAQSLYLQYLLAGQGLAPAPRGYLRVYPAQELSAAAKSLSKKQATSSDEEDMSDSEQEESDVAGPLDPVVTFWLLTDLVPREEPRAANFQALLAQLLHFSARVAPLLLADLRAPVQQAMQWLQPAPERYLWLKTTFDAAECSVIRLSNLLSLVANSYASLPKECRPCVWQFIEPHADDKTLGTCAIWWKQTLSSRGSPLFQARQSLQSFPMSSAGLFGSDLPDLGLGDEWELPLPNVWWTQTGKATLTKAWTECDLTLAQVQQFLGVLVRVALSWQRPSVSKGPSRLYN